MNKTPRDIEMICILLPVREEGMKKDESIGIAKTRVITQKDRQAALREPVSVPAACAACDLLRHL